MRRSPLLALTALLACPAHAGLLGPAYLDAGYQHQVEREVDLEGQGFSVGGSVSIASYFFAGVGYSSVRTEPFITTDNLAGRYEYRAISGSLGGYLPVTDRAGVSAAAGYSFSQTLGLDELADQPVENAEGMTGSLSLHYQLVRWVDMSLGGGYSFVGGVRSMDGSAGLSLHAWRDVWIDGSYWVAEGSEGWTGGLRVRFGD